MRFAIPLSIHKRKWPKLENTLATNTTFVMAFTRMEPITMWRGFVIASSIIVVCKHLATAHSYYYSTLLYNIAIS